MKYPIRTLFAFAILGVLAACSGGGRGLTMTPNEMASLRSFGAGDCEAVVSNMTGRRIEAFYVTGLEERKVRSAMEIWPLIGYMETSESILLRAPCSDRQVVIGWRLESMAAVPFADEVAQRQTLLQGEITPIRLRRPSEASCATDNAVNSIKSRCLFGG